MKQNNDAVPLSKVLNEIAYSIDDGYEPRITDDGAIVINKLYINERFMAYKVEEWEMSKGVYLEVKSMIEALIKHRENKQ